MSLTGLPLLTVSLLATVGSLVALVVVWRRFGRWRVLIRTLGIVIFEVLTLFTASLAINRAGDFYPSWSSLRSSASTNYVAPTPTGDLGQWLVTHAPNEGREGLVFTWRPPGVSLWQLVQPPIVYVPAAYFQLTTSSFPVVVAVAPDKARGTDGAWDGGGVANLLQTTTSGATPAVVVFVRSGGANRSTVLSDGLPSRLDQDLRVTRHGWAIVGVGPDATVAYDVYTHNLNRYAAAALVAEGTGRLGIGAIPVGSQVLGVAGVTGRRPAGATIDHVVRAEARMPTALEWAFSTLPAALTAPLVDAPAPTH